MSKQDIENNLETIETYCRNKGVRFTDQRRIVFKTIAASQKPVGAYDILAEVGKTINNPKPTTIYRALDFFQEHGFVHKIESLNAFVACHAGHTHKGSQFMVCDECGNVAEIHLCEIPAELEDKMLDQGFTLQYWNTEIHGVCQDCRG